MINIVDKKDCCGCSACASVCSKNAISMQADALGFFYPQVDKLNCVNCGLCESVCPIINRKKNVEKRDPLSYVAARNKNKEILFKSTSGGVFSSLAKLIISQNGVVYGACYNERLEVVHDFADTEENCEKFIGSKYVQSRTVGIFSHIKKDLERGIPVLFTGTPCQVESVRKFLRKNYENLFLVDVVCHAVASPKVFQDYVTFAEKKLKSSIKSIRMRDKMRYGWGHRTSTAFVLRDGTIVRDPSSLKMWNEIYFSAFVNRPSCNSCLFCNMNRSGDLTIGDFWDDSSSRKDIYSIEGTSLVMVNNEKGIRLLNMADSLDCWKLKKEDVSQQNLVHASQPNCYSEKFINDYQRKGFKYVYFRYVNRSYLRRLLSRIKHFLLRN